MDRGARACPLVFTPPRDANGNDGKSGNLGGRVAFPGMRSEKSYTFSGSTAEGAPERGVNPGIEDSYSASNASTQVFDMAFLKIDSDQALAAAQKHGGDKILEKEPDTPLVFLVDLEHHTHELLWHVI